MGLRLRLLAVLFLAVLPVIWSYCPCCLVGAGCGAPQASHASQSGPARRTCSCCDRKGKETPAKGAKEGPTAPKDCDGCAAWYARAGALTAPSDVALPALDGAAVLPVPTVEALRSLETAPIARPGGPAPPGPRHWPLSTVVLRI